MFSIRGLRWRFSHINRVEEHIISLCNSKLQVFSLYSSTKRSFQDSSSSSLLFPFHFFFLDSVAGLSLSLYVCLRISHKAQRRYPFNSWDSPRIERRMGETAKRDFSPLAKLGERCFLFFILLRLNKTQDVVRQASWTGPSDAPRTLSPCQGTLDISLT